MVAYDLETDPIKAGTPRPRYITAYGSDFRFSERIKSTAHLRRMLIDHFLTEDRQGTAYVAWNGNRFDCYFIAAALIQQDEYLIRPFLTSSGAVRGLLVTVREDGDKRTGRRWSFLDGMSMLGLPGLSLEKFLAVFAPDHKKLSGAINWEAGEVFDADNPAHIAYADRDAEGLYHAMTRAAQIIYDNFEEPLRATVGSCCIRILTKSLPAKVEIDALTADAMDVCRQYVVRGGYCVIMRAYRGPVWKYDINQAYAASMREADLPCGGMLRGRGKPHPSTVAYMVRITARNPRNKVPFYHRVRRGERIVSTFSLTEIEDTWITGIEHRQLISEGWEIECHGCWEWARTFRLTDYVDRLERLRTTAEGGPSGPIGLMVKAVGNNSFGKTLEHALPIDFMFASECPDGVWESYYGNSAAPIDHVYYRIEPRKPKPYHQPQIGAHITAHTRMVLRRAALLAPDSFLYADTDCIMYDRDMTAQLDIDPKRYGAWKIEEEGAPYQLIAKKVYRALDDSKRSAKGMRVRELSADDFERWAEGDVPEQHQVQLLGLLGVLNGDQMYRTQTRKGTSVKQGDMA